MEIFTDELLRQLEAWSYIVTIVGLPLAMLVFIHEQRKERQIDEEELYQRLSDEYAEFLHLVLENADLHLRKLKAPISLSPEQEERKFILFEILIALFERAFILVFEENMSKQTRRLWSSWEDYMREWCQREDFRRLLPQLLEGEDPDFVQHIKRVAAEVESEKSKA